MGLELGCIFDASNEGLTESAGVGREAGGELSAMSAAGGSEMDSVLSDRATPLVPGGSGAAFCMQEECAAATSKRSE